MKTLTKSISSSGSIQIGSAIKQLMSKPTLLTSEDCNTLLKIEQLKVQLKQLTTSVSGKIQATVEKFGYDTVVIGNHTVKLSEHVRHAISWKSLATALLEASVIDEFRETYTVESTSYSAK
ncbi:hypothetical protein LCGC14_2949980, partial [marine sediment metagenome]